MFRKIKDKCRFRKFCKEFLSVLRKTYFNSNDISPDSFRPWINFLYYLCFEKDELSRHDFVTYRNYAYFSQEMKKYFKKFFQSFSRQDVEKTKRLVLKNITHKKRYNICVIYSDYFRREFLEIFN